MITFDNVSFRYHKREKDALSGICGQIGTGIHLLAGANGSGKTTLLHVAAGLLKPVSGECLIDGIDSFSQKPGLKRRIFLLEEDMVFPAKTIREFAHVHSRFYPGFSNNTFCGNLSAFGLTGDEPLQKLSLGNRKKAQLAYVLALGVDFLFLDEPTNALDIQGKEILRKLFARQTASGQTVLVATHNVSELGMLFDGILLLKGAHALYCGTAEDIEGRLGFVRGRTPDAGALYTEMQLGQYLSVVEAAGAHASAVDWRLLYNAVYSQNGDLILKTLK